MTWKLLVLSGVVLATMGLFSNVEAQVEEGEVDARLASDQGIDIRADRLEYQAEKKVTVGRGHVVVTRGADTMRADLIEVNASTSEAHAKGHVVFESEGRRWEGEELTYNFKTQKGDFGAFTAYADPFYVTAKESKRVSTNEFLLKGATFSTCEGEHPEVYMRASSARLLNGRYLRAKGAVLYLKGIPIFYLPFFKHDLDRVTHLDVVPGASSRMGAFLLVTYNYPVTDWLKSKTHLDYRTKRGWAGGQDFIWESPSNTYNGSARAYVLKDNDPYKDDEEKAERESLMKDSRYRLSLSDVRNITDRDYVMTEVNYLSDPWVLDDFFDREYRTHVQPENRINLAHRGDRYTAGLLINKRLNDFYSNVDRVPEAYFDMTRQQIMESPFYYEGNNRASYLQMVFPEDSEDEKYDAVRVDSGHKVYYPTRHFGFLNVIPRAGYRGTYYSKTRVTETVTNLVPVTDTNNVVIGYTNEVETIVKDGDGKLRNLFELGFETSLKAFKVLTEDPIGLERDMGLRHVLEPYANYTYVPEPNLRPADLPQFDAVDKLDRRNDILLGVRNKLQTKQYTTIHDLVDFNLYTYYRFKPEVYENDFSDIFFDTRLRPVDWFMMDFQGGYDSYNNEISFFNSQVAFIGEDESRLSFEYRYRKDAQDQIAAAVDLWPGSKWSLSAYERYNFDTKELEEQSYGIEHRSSCTGQGLYLKQTKDDEVEVWFQFWILAFPSSYLSVGQ